MSSRIGFGKGIRWLLALLLTAVLCHQAAAAELRVPKDQDDFVRQTIEALRTGDFNTVANALDPKLRTPTLGQQLAGAAGLFPPGFIRSVETIDFLPGKPDPAHPENFDSTFQLQYHIGDRWVGVAASIVHANNTTVMTGFRILPLSESVEATNRFTFAGKSAVNYGFALAMLVVPLLSLFALVNCVAAPGLRFKWIWAVAIVIGFCQVTMNWTAGTVAFDPLFAEPFGLWLTRSGLYGPWMVSVGFPVGAVAYLVKRFLLDARRQPEAFPA